MTNTFSPVTVAQVDRFSTIAVAPVDHNNISPSAVAQVDRTFSEHKHRFKKILKSKIAVSFYNELTAHPTFKAHPKAIMAAWYLLNLIGTWNALNENKETTAYSVLLKELFRMYCPTVSYTIFITALEELGLLNIIRKDYWLRGIGACRGYYLSHKAISILKDSAMEYFKNLHEDKQVIRKTQQNISKSKILKDDYQDEFLNALHLARCKVSFDYQEVKEVAGELAPAQQNQLFDVFNTLKDKRFDDLKYHEETGRVWDELNSVPKIARHLLKMDGKAYWGEIDQRACHLSYLGDLLYFCAQSNPPLPFGYSPHYFGGLGDIKSISAERDAYNSFILAHEDPRKQLAKDLQLPFDRIKDRLNRWINEGKDKKLNKWFSSTFPLLAKIKDTLDPKKLGVMIMKRYESPLWTDPRLYKWLKEHDLSGHYSYDGINIFGNASEDSMGEFIDFINAIAKEKCGHDIVVKAKGWGFSPCSVKVKVPEKVRSNMTTAIESIHKERAERFYNTYVADLYNKVEKNWRYFNNKFFFSAPKKQVPRKRGKGMKWVTDWDNVSRADWDKFSEGRAIYKQGLEQCVVKMKGARFN